MIGTPAPRPANRDRALVDRVPMGLVSAVVTILLGVVAAALVLVILPRAFGIESSCVGTGGVDTTTGDVYIGGFVTFGTIGWLAVFLGTLFAAIVERRRLMIVLPVAWFATLITAAVVAGAIVGPAPCPS